MKAITTAFHFWCFIFLLPSAELVCQSPELLFHFSGQQMQLVGPLTTLRNGHILVGGTYESDVLWNGHQLDNAGGSDIFICNFNPNQNNPSWILGGGGPVDDQLSGFATDTSDNILIIGSAFGNFTLNDLELDADFTENPKFLFLIKISEEGEVINGWTIQGTQDYALTNATSDSQGNWIVGGFFQGALFFQDTTLVSQSQSDLFLAKFDPSGNLLWALREGITGITRPTAIKTDREGNIVCAGIFDRITSFAGVELEASTNDRDIFFAKYSTQGAGIWGFKAGGVLDDDLVDMEISSSGHIFAAGYFKGVLNPGGGIVLQTDDGDPDFFILKYDENGQPEGGVSFGGTESQFAKDIAVSNQKVLLTGVFNGILPFKGSVWNAGPDYAGFFGLFTESLEFVKGSAITASDGFYPSAGNFDPDGNIWISGNFAGFTNFGDTILTAEGDFDGLLIRMLNPSEVARVSSPPIWEIVSNPVADRIEVKGWKPGDTLFLLNMEGKLLDRFETGGQISVAKYPVGLYFLICHRADQRSVFRVVKGF